jgi:polar amino acid transport system substrate-binding protein
METNMKISLKFKTVIAMVIAIFAATAAVANGPLMDRIESGKTIRIGFANEIPWAYPGEGNKPVGFANVHALGVLKAMGYDNIEPVVTDWGGLIPGLKAKRFDIITGGMYILSSRCANVDFAEPMGSFGDAFIVPKGNPKGLVDFATIRDSGSVMATGAGYVSIESAKKEGVPDENIMALPGPTEILAAVRSGRADAGAVTFFTGRDLAATTDGEIEVTDPSLMPLWTKNWVGIAFSPDDKDFLAAFNDAQAEYLGSDEMLTAVGEYEYTSSQLPGDVTTSWICANR